MAEPSKCDIIVRNGALITMDSESRVFASGAVATLGSRILAVGSEQEILDRFQATTTIDAQGGVIHPGFIDAHTHVNIHIGRSFFSERPEGGGPSFEDWYQAMQEKDEMASARLIGLELLRNGYTCFAEPGSALATDAVAEAAGSIGVRVVLADPLLWDRLEPGEAVIGRMKLAPVDLERCLKVLGRELRRNRDPDGLSHGYIAINNISNASDELLKAALETARAAGSVLQLHHNRTLALAEKVDRRFGGPNLLRLYERGLLTENCTFTHMNIIRDEEMDAVAKSGMSIIWCPANTMFYGVTMTTRSPIPELMKRGVSITTGADLAKAWTFSDMELIAYLLARAEGNYISPVQLLEMRTRAAAKALGLSREIGSLEPGKRADIVVRTNDVPEALPGLNLAQDMMLSARSKNVTAVCVNGKVVYRDGRPTQVDPAQVYAEIRANMTDLMSRSGIRPSRYWVV